MQGIVDSIDRQRITIASLLEVELNLFLKTLPQESESDKRAIARFMTAFSRTFGMAVASPRSGQPCSVAVHGEPGRHFRYQFKTTANGWATAVCSGSMTRLAELRLVPRPTSPPESERER